MAPIFVVAALLLGVWPSLAQDYFWSGKNGNARRSGSSPHTVRVNFSTGPAWHWNDDVQVFRAGPLIDDKRNIYQSSSTGNVYKFSPEGLQLWHYDAGAHIPSFPYIYNGIFYALLNDKGCILLALDMETGQERWRIKIASDIHPDTASLLVHQGIIVAATAMARNVARGFAPSINNMLLGLSAEDGKLKWSFSPDCSIYNLLASATEDSVMFMDHCGGVYRLGLQDGALIWQHPAGFPSFSTGAAVLGDNDVFYAVSNSLHTGVIQAYRASDGRRLWRRQTGDFEGNQAPAVGYLQGRGKGLSVVAAIGKNPGQAFQMPLFTKLLSWWPHSILPISSSVKYIYDFAVWVPEHIGEWIVFGQVPEHRGRLIALDAETGETQWIFTPPLWPHHACNGDVRRFKDRAEAHGKNHRNEMICLPDSWAAPTISADGTVYAGFMDGKLYAVRDDNNDGWISDNEYTSFDSKDAWLGPASLAPGLLVGSPCGGGLYVFTV